MKRIKLFILFLGTTLNFTSLTYAKTNFNKVNKINQRITDISFIQTVLYKFNSKYFLDKIQYNQKFFIKENKQNTNISFTYETHIKKHLEQEKNLYIISEFF